ncbi:MAG: zinc ribbon domain-containing protein [Fibromonadaceae bacterium]|jgi:ribosomal protein L40E|nr:zinc ribbon domain-containing protein [Fibromonadaceae bacterium]
MNWNIKTDKTFQNEWNEFKDDHSTEGYTLRYVFEIYLPFWQCKQNIVVEKDLEMDRFSKILLELISNDLSSHTNICQFLGIEENNFCTMQLHFLIRNNLIRESGTDGYEITHEGLEFLKDRKKPKTMETEKFDYMVKERYSFLENDMTNDFFDPLMPIDKQLTGAKKADFSGYKILQTHKNKIKEQGKIYVKHNNNGPTYKKIEGKRNDFSDFFNTLNPSKIFYDFADSEFESHKRSICFLGFWYENKEKQEDRKIDIRQFKESVEKFENYELERELSKKVTEYVLKNDIRVGNEQSKTQENIGATEQSEFKFCPECGTKLKTAAKFCTKCGVKQDIEVIYE